MSELILSCELKLLTASKDVGLRRWRSFAAAMGGSGQIFHAASDLLQHLDTSTNDQTQHIVIYDQSLPLSLVDLARLQTQSRLFILRPPTATSGSIVPLATAPAWQVEAYFQCSLAALLESPVVRMSLTQLILSAKVFQAESLLRWGYAAETCNAEGAQLDAISLAFSRGLNLTGEARRLTEMFTHFLHACLPSLHLVQQIVTFGSDGILTLVSARCTILPGMSIHAVAAELRIHEMQITITNRLPGNSLEIAGLCYPQLYRPTSDESMLLVFNKNHRPAEAAAAQPQGPEAASATPLTITHKAG